MDIPHYIDTYLQNCKLKDYDINDIPLSDEFQGVKHIYNYENGKTYEIFLDKTNYYYRNKEEILFQLQTSNRHKPKLSPHYKQLKYFVFVLLWPDMKNFKWDIKDIYEVPCRCIRRIINEELYNDFIYRYDGEPNISYITFHTELLSKWKLPIRKK